MVNDSSIRNSIYSGISALYSDEVIITQTTVTNSSIAGISLTDVESFSIKGCVVIGSNGTGIESIYCGTGELIQNRIYFSTKLGINITGTTSITAFANAIGWNTLGNCFDVNFGNSWNYNFWDDCQEFEEYAIAGPGMNIDHHPTRLLFPELVNPLINHPEDIVVNETSTEFAVVWAPSVLKPNTYIILMNGSIYQECEWDGSLVVFQIGALHNSVYNFTIIVIDSMGQTISDSVFVNIEVSSLPTTTPTEIANTILISILMMITPAILASIFILVVYHRRKIR
jgi:hypothetical protein